MRHEDEREKASLSRLESRRRALLHVRAQVRRDARRAQPEVRVVAMAKNLISEQDQVQAIYFDLRSDQGQIIFVIFLPIEKIKI